MFAASAEMFFTKEQDTAQDKITPKLRAQVIKHHGKQAPAYNTQNKTSILSTSAKGHMAVSANSSTSASLAVLNPALGLIPPSRPKSVTRLAFLAAAVIYCCLTAGMFFSSLGEKEVMQLDVGGAVHTIGLEQFVAAPAPQEATVEPVQEQVQPEPTPMVQPEPEPEVQPEPIPEVKPEPKPEPKPEVKPVPEKKVTPKPVVEKKVAPQPVVKKQEAQPKVKPVTKSESKQAVTNKTVAQSTGAPQSNRPQVMVYGRDNHPVLTQIKSAIDKALVYPRKAQMMRAEGVAVVQFTYTTGGQIKRLKLLKSTGTRELDKAALLTIKRASGNFPSVEQSFTLRLPIAFEIR